MRVDPDEVKQVAGSLLIDRSASAVFGAQRISIRSGWALIDGIADARLPRRRVISVDGRRTVIRIRVEDVADFADRFATIVRIAYAAVRRHADVMTMLRAARVRHRVERRHLRIELIRRTVSPAGLAA